MATCTSTPYSLIAFDMDGTLLNSRQEITPRTVAAVNRACAVGQGAAICTGRAYDEMQEYAAVLGSVWYMVCCSGAYVYEDGKCIFSSLMEPEVVITSLDIASAESAMVNILTERSYVQRSEMAHIEDYHMEVYRDFYERIGTKADDLTAFYKAAPFPIGKVNFFHRSAESRARTRARMEAAGGAGRDGG